MQHFYNSITKHSVEVQSGPSIESVRTQLCTKRVACEKRQSYNNTNLTMEQLKMVTERSMLMEHDSLLPLSSNNCSCLSCAPHPTCPSGCSSSFLYCPGIEETPGGFLYLTQNFAMSHLCFRNMLSDLQSLYAGVSYPALYVGGIHSTFPLHIEDLSCWSFNFLLDGCPKFW